MNNQRPTTRDITDLNRAISKPGKYQVFLNVLEEYIPTIQDEELKATLLLHINHLLRLTEVKYNTQFTVIDYLNYRIPE